KQYYQATGSTEYSKSSLTYANEFTATYSAGGTITGPDTTFDAMYLTYAKITNGTLGMNPTYTAANFTSPYTFGATDGGRCNPLTIGAAAVSLQKYSLYAAVTTGSVNVKMALYTDSSGKPSALVAGSASQPVTITQTTPGWLDFPSVGNPTLSA